MNAHPLSEALQHSDRLWSREQLFAAIARLGRELDLAYASAEQPPVFLTVMNGGMFFGAYLAHASKVDYHFDYVHATRYRSGTMGHALELVKAPRTPLHGRDVLIVDDILDEGKTLVMVRDWCLAQGASSVRIAVLAEKKHDRCVPGFKADFVGVEVADRYVYGFGMDYYEQGRSLDAIYALKD
ncbi:MAG: hypoxanthine-guanine phosphoribosyltransferase [Xanthomonadales bacterium]|nr:hypoxanthine-guanine phosphoribosyltransferase [Xanthomonadales bacterium]